MKRSHLLLILVALFFCASENGYCQVRVGIRAGLNVASANFDEIKFGTYDFDPIVRFGAGIASEMNLSDHFFLRPELMYSIKGWKNGDVATDLNYLNLPVMVGYRPIPVLSLLAGGELGYLLNSKSVGYEEFDYGVAVGTAYSVTENLSVELRYTYGLAPLMKAMLRDYNNAPLGEYHAGHNRVGQLSVVYFFN